MTGTNHLKVSFEQNFLGIAGSFRTMELIVALSSLRYLPSIFFLFFKLSTKSVIRSAGGTCALMSNLQAKNATESIRPFYLIFRYLSHVPFVLSSFLYGVPELKKPSLKMDI